MQHRSGKIFVLASAFVIAPGCSFFLHGQTPNGSSSDVFRAGGLSFALPSPDKELVEAGPDYRAVLEPLAPANNRLVAAFVLPAVLPALRTGTFPPLREYALIEVPRRAEFADVTPEIFQQIVDVVSKQFAGNLAGIVQEQQAAVNQELKALGNTNSVTLQNPIPLGSFFSKGNASGFGMIMPVADKGSTVKMLMAMSVIRAHKRVIFAYLYTEYGGDSSVTWLRTVAEQWTDAIIKANP